MFTLGEASRCDIRSQFGQDRRFVGECQAKAAPDMDVRSQRCQVGRVTLCFLRATTPTRFRRTKRHIADDRADLAVLWFVRCGSLVLEDGAGKRRIGPNELALTRSHAPLLAQCRPDRDGVHEALHVVLDAEHLREALGGDPREDGIWSTQRGPLAIAATLLADAFENDDALQPASSIQLVETALLLVRHGLFAGEASSSVAPSPANGRLHAILRFIDLQLTNPHLSRAMVAQRCEISERYLSTLLERHGTSFSELLWQGRLERARAWLAVSDGRDLTIAEIGYALGFKSPAHFTRKFHRTYGISPRTYRDSPQTA